MAILHLTSIVPPPSNPSEVPVQNSWKAIEQRLEVSFPDDYKEFIETYGSGRIGQFLWIFNPFSGNENINLERQIGTQANVLSELQSYGEIIPYKSFPEREGILPFGMTDNGDVLFWLTKGDPNEWGVIVNEARSPAWEIFDLSMSRFLAGILQKKVICNIFPKSFPDLPITFEVKP